MREIVTIERAKEVAEELKKAYKFGTAECPAWFMNTCTPMGQDTSYSIAICIPSLNSIQEEESNKFIQRFNGVQIILRVVTKSSYKSIKNKEIKK